MSYARAVRRLSELKRRAASLPHGTRSRYVGGGCRCWPCRISNRLYNRERNRKLAMGKAQPNPLVPADAARAHMRKLTRAGVGKRTLCDVAMLSMTVVERIRRGESRKIRRETEQAILSVGKAAAHGNALLPAGPTWKILDGLIEDGYTKTQLAKWLGYARSIQLQRDRVTAKNAGKVRRMAALIEQGKLVRDV
jgi:hypothetical protein